MIGLELLLEGQFCRYGHSMIGRAARMFHEGLRVAMKGVSS